MRILLFKESKIYLFDYLKRKYNCHSYNQLSIQMRIPFKTLQNWLYGKGKYLPERIIPKEIFEKLKIENKEEENWGQSKGGKKTYKILINRYGLKEIRRRQSKGGKNSSKKRNKELLSLDIYNKEFLEFYGRLLGDGWISIFTNNYKGKYRKSWWVAMCGHIKKDKEFLLETKEKMYNLFDRRAYVKYKPKSNAMEIIIGHKELLYFLNKELGFPIGKKINLKISDKFCGDWINMKYIIKGIFDTDGSFYLDKTASGNDYPCISIEMKAPILIKQLYNALISKEFKVTHKQKEGEISRITLKGSKQIKKWMNEVGSSNSRHLNKINQYLNHKCSGSSAG